MSPKLSSMVGRNRNKIRAPDAVDCVKYFVAFFFIWARSECAPHPYRCCSVLLLLFIACPPRGCLGRVCFCRTRHLLRHRLMGSRGLCTWALPNVFDSELELTDRSLPLPPPHPPWMLDLISLTSIRNGIHYILHCCAFSVHLLVLRMESAASWCVFWVLWVWTTCTSFAVFHATGGRTLGMVWKCWLRLG
jgi:hypothetical protein